MTYEEYADLEGINYSVLKEGRRSAKHLQHRLQTQREDTIRLGLGRAAHCLVLTPDLFPLEFAVWTGGQRRGKAWDEFCAATPGRTRIKADEYAHCLGMRDAIKAHPVAGPLLAAPGESEKTIQWIDPDTELQCKARIDRLSDATVLDLKTTAELEAHRFGSLAARYGYHGQMAFYRMGLRALGMDRPAKLIAVEPLPPYDVAVFSLSDDVIWAGEEEVKELLAMVAAGAFSKRWPGRYEDGEIPLELPSWVYPEADAVAELGITFNQEEAA